MKSAIVLTIVAIIVSVQAGEDYLAQGDLVINSCLPAHPIAADEVARLKAGDFSGSSDQSVQCFVKCFFDAASFFLPNGELNDQAVAEGLSAPADLAKAVATAQRCHAVQGSSDCDRAYQIYKCYKTGF